MLKVLIWQDIIEKVRANPAHFENTILCGIRGDGNPQQSGASSASPWGQGSQATFQKNGLENAKGLDGQRAAVIFFLQKFEASSIYI